MNVNEKDFSLFTFLSLLTTVVPVMNGIAQVERRLTRFMLITVKFYNNYPRGALKNCENWKEPLINSFFSLLESPKIAENCSRKHSKYK